MVLSFNAPHVQRHGSIDLVKASGTATAGAATTITLAADSNATDDFYNGYYLIITAGTGAGQIKAIADYVGATKVATVTTWGTNPDNTSEYIITPFNYTGTTAPAGDATYELVLEETASTAKAALRIEHATASEATSEIVVDFATLGLKTPKAPLGVGDNSEILHLFPVYFLTNPASLTGLVLGTGYLRKNSGSTGYEVVLKPASNVALKVVSATFFYGI